MAALEYKTPSFDELTEVPRKGVVARSTKATCIEFHSHFCSLAAAEEDPIKKRVWRFLARVTGYGLSLEESDDRFQAAVAALLEEDIKLVKRLVDEVESPELKARLCDIVWTRRRKYNIKYVALASLLI